MKILNDYTSSRLNTGKSTLSSDVYESSENFTQKNTTYAVSEKITDVVKSTLDSLGFKITPESLKMATSLIENNFPVSKENMQTLNKAAKLLGDNNFEKAVFFLNNDISPNSKTAEIFNNILGHSNTFSSQLKSLIDSILTYSLNTNNTDILRLFIDDSTLLSTIFNDAKQTYSSFASIIKKEAAEILKNDANAIKLRQNLNTAKSNSLNKKVSSEDTLNKQDKASSKITTEQFVTQNKELLMPSIIKAIQESSPEILINAAQNFGFNEPLNLKKTFELALWDNPALKNKGLKMLEPTEKKDYTNITSKAENSLSVEEQIKENKPQIILELHKSLQANSLEPFNNSMKNMGLINVSSNKILQVLFDDKPEVQKKVSSLLDKKNAITDKASKNIFFDRAKNKEELSSYVNKLSERLSLTKQAISEIGSQASGSVSKNLNDINNNLDFMSQIKNTFFMQIPVTINNNLVNAELYVFNNKKGASSGSSSSALIALDLVFLGHFEAYIQKNNNSINCQFRIENDDLQKLIKENIVSLASALKQYNYYLEQYTFKKIDEAFSVLSSEPTNDDKAEELKQTKNYTFDLQT